MVLCFDSTISEGFYDWAWKDILIYGNNNRFLEKNLILCLLSRIIVVGSSLEPMTCLAQAAWLSNGGNYE